jgi:thermitase
VEAAGNFATDTPVFPAGFSLRGALVVAASEQSDALAPFSDFGSWVTVAAPGDGIVSAVPGGGTGVWAGTSMASPLVAGEVALVRSLSPAARTPDLVSAVSRSSVRVKSPVRLRPDAAAATGA